MATLADSIPASRRLSQTNLSHLTLMELDAVHDAFTTAVTVYMGFQNQPRCEVNGAGLILEDECERLYEAMSEVVVEARGRVPRTPHEGMFKAKIMARSALETEDWVGALAAINNPLMREAVA